MAFNINITKRGNVDFEKLNFLSNSLDKNYVTIFPIIKNEFQKEEGIGLSINLKKDYSEFWEIFENFLIELIDKKYNIVELYNGGKINNKNIESLKKLLK
jgi:hypothetical protein